MRAVERWRSEGKGTDAAALVEQFLAGHLTPLQHVDDCLDCIDRRDGDIGAWSYVDRVGARDRASALSAGADVGLLHGVCVGVKDVLDTYDMPTQHGSPVYEGHRPERDSACVAALRASGAILLGKTRPTEFASPVAVGVRNPLDPTRSAGVSSSGSAAAVAAGMVPLALGTQTGGSIIRPASYCGIVGLKPSLDAISRAAILHLRPSLDTIGVFARSVEDAGLFLRAVTGVSGEDPPRNSASPIRFGVCHTSEWHRAKPIARAALARAAGAARVAGAQVDEIELPGTFDHALEAFRIIVTVETARTMAREFMVAKEQLNEWLQGIPGGATKISELEYQDALSLAAACRQELAPWFAQFDALLAPATAGEAIAALHGLDDPWFCPLWTMMHGPALTIPVARGPLGLPVGIQIIGPPGGDFRLLEVARWLEIALAGPSAA